MCRACLGVSYTCDPDTRRDQPSQVQRRYRSRRAL